MYCITYLFMKTEVKYKLPESSLEYFLKRLDYYGYSVISVVSIV